MPATMRPKVDLPQPDSPTRPEHLARRDRQIDAVDGMHRFLADIRAEALGDSCRRGRGVFTKRLLTSSAVRIGAAAALGC